jgi:BirA family biotin operon repressor/biotin-[acetyl-CoA-carboxylase] ligase
MAGRIQMLAAVAVVRALRIAVKVKGRGKVGVKWPNDIVVGGRKLGGILVETKTVANALLFAVVGVGINVNQSEGSLPDGAVSLQTFTGREGNLQLLLRLILHEFESKYGDLQSPSKLVSEWWTHCVHKMKNVRIDGPERTAAGVNRGITRDGVLLVETLPGHLVRVSEGTLRMLD